NIESSELEKLMQLNINEDLGGQISMNGINLDWENDIVKLVVKGETETLNIKIWLDEESNEFKYKSPKLQK
ncbi:MAG: hypothetical protein ACRC68_17720, partial [Clostridium sp.]